MSDETPEIVKIAQSIQRLTFKDALLMAEGFEDMDIGDGITTFRDAGLNKMELALSFSSWADCVMVDWERGEPNAS